MRLTGGAVFRPGKGFVREELGIEGGRIVRPETDDRAVDLSGCYLLPGLIDLHFHGCVGEDFSDATAEGLQKMADYELSRGVTAICPAGMTLPEEQLTALCANAAAHRDNSTSGAELVGLNLEGPFLSEAKKGAQNAAYLRAPDPQLLRKLHAASKGLAKLVTLAPEEPHALELIETAKELGVRVSLGHTTADYDTAAGAYAAGARQATHLFNAMPPLSHRQPGVAGAAFDHPEVSVELICDGVHIHPAMVRAVFRLFGRDRVIMISDTMRATGLPDGQYTLGGQEVTVRGPLCTLTDGTIAGSATDLMKGLVTAVGFGIPLADAVTAATVNPAKALGVYDRMGSLDVGKEANVVVLAPDLSLRAVIFRGQVVSGAL